MDSPFAKEYASQTGVTLGSQPMDESTDKSTEDSPFAKEYQAQTGVKIQPTPQDITKATSKNISNPNTGNADFSGWCQAFVEQATNSPQKFPSAQDAWNNYVQTGQARENTKDMQPGDVIYFSPNHTGIFAGQGKFISATDNGIETKNINDWQKETGQQVLGYVKNPSNLPQIGGQYGPN